MTSLCAFDKAVILVVMWSTEPMWAMEKWAVWAHRRNVGMMWNRNDVFVNLALL